MYFEKNSHFGKQTFWQKRYAENATQFDWYQDWEHLRDIISQFANKNSKILNIGAGNSPFSQSMYEQGYKNITNIDFSEIVVQDMQLKYKNRNYEDSLKYVYGDVRNMKQIFQNQAFDVVIDKGTLDSILCGAYSKQNGRKSLRQISRVLKNKGFYICVSYGDPDIRFNYFEKQFYEWVRITNTPYKVYKPNIDENEKDIIFNDKDKDKNKDYYHYVYIMQKGAEYHGNPMQSQMKTSNIMLSSTNNMR